MDFFTPSDILFYLSIALLIFNSVFRFISTKRYWKENGEHRLTDEQQKKIKRIALPIAFTAVAAVAASLIISIISLHSH